MSADKETVINKIGFQIDFLIYSNKNRQDVINDLFNICESYSASQNSELVERVKKLQSTCLAAAEEIQSKWEAHCDNDGYGPANLMRRLENGVGDYYSGYNAGQFTKLENQNSELKKENELYKNKVEFYRETTDKCRQFVFANKDIGYPSQPLWDAVYDKLTDLKKENEEWRQECERLAGVADFWQKKYYEVVPPHQNPKLDNL